MTIKGASEFITNVKQPTAEIDATIEQLETEIIGINEQLEAIANDFSLAVVKQKKELANDLKTLEGILADAEKKRIELVAANSEEFRVGARALIQANREEKRALHVGDKQKIADMIKEIRDFYDGRAETDRRYAEEEKAFVAEIVPYLDDPRGNIGQPAVNNHVQELKNLVNTSRYYRGQTFVIPSIQDYDFGTERLLDYKVWQVGTK